MGNDDLYLDDKPTDDTENISLSAPGDLRLWIYILMEKYHFMYMF